MFRSLLTTLKPAVSQAAVTDYAVSLAERLHLRIHGLAVVDRARLAPSEPVPLGASAYKAELDQQHIAQGEQRAAAVVRALEAAASARSLPCEARVAIGATVREIVSAAQVADLLVCGHRSEPDMPDWSLLLEILKHVPRPAVVVPDMPPAGDRVLVAYDGSFQAGRALSSFVHSRIGEGLALTVLSLHEDPALAQRHAHAAREFLGGHEIAADALSERLVKEPGRQILEAIPRLNAGLLVMGAFGKSAMREFFFGSATRALLQRLIIPVFLDH